MTQMKCRMGGGLVDVEMGGKPQIAGKCRPQMAQMICRMGWAYCCRDGMGGKPQNDGRKCSRR
jgi:hypothetical protein